jgi:hypothetical protein
MSRSGKRLKLQQPLQLEVFLLPLNNGSLYLPKAEKSSNNLKYIPWSPKCRLKLKVVPALANQISISLSARLSSLMSQVLLRPPQEAFDSLIVS